MGFFSKHEVASLQQVYVLPPATLFRIFTDPENGCDLFGAQEYRITSGQPGRPGQLQVVAAFEAARIAKDFPLAEKMGIVSSNLDITLREKPYSVTSRGHYGPFKARSEIDFRPQGKNTVLHFEINCELPLHLRPAAAAVRHVLNTRLYHTFTTLAVMAKDNKATAALHARKPL